MDMADYLLVLAIGVSLTPGACFVYSVEKRKPWAMEVAEVMAKLQMPPFL